MAPVAQTKMTAEEYLERERAAETKSEFYDGEVFAMAGASRWHSMIVANLVATLHAKLRNGPCRVFSNDLRLQVEETGLFAYPDVMVACGEPRFLDEGQDTLLDPVLIIEVLSPSTADYDRGGKCAHYRSIPSLIDYLIVAQDRAHVERWTRVRDTEGRWIFDEIHGLDGSVRLDSVDSSLDLAEIYLEVSRVLDAEAS